MALPLSVEGALYDIVTELTLAATTPVIVGASGVSAKVFILNELAAGTLAPIELTAVAENP
jgi:hypothetical protein